MQNVRLGVTPARTRLVLDLSSAPVSATVSAGTGNAVDLWLRGAAPDPRCPRSLAGDGLLREASVASVRGRFRLHLLLLQPCRVRRSLLTSPETGGARLVVDLIARGPISGVTAARQPARAARAAGRPAPAAAKRPSIPGPASPVTPTRPRASGPQPPEAPEAAVNPAVTPATVPAVTPAAIPEVTPAVTPALSSAPADSAASGPRLVVVDAGHGGSDPGAIARGLQEKEVTLDVARRLVSILNQDGGIRAVLTRDGDFRIPLRQRMELAEKKSADLFLSIHINAAPSRQAAGTEVFFLSIGGATDEASRELARLENESDSGTPGEDDGLRQLPFLVNLRQSDTMLRSSRAAETVLDVLTARRLAQERGVKQAGFAVLKSTQVPSILVELGFLSNAHDRAQLRSPDHRQDLASALSEGVRRYFERYAPRKGPAPAP